MAPACAPRLRMWPLPAPFPLLFPDAAPPVRAALALVAQAQGAGEAFKARRACEAWEAALTAGPLGGRAKRKNLCGDHGVRFTRTMKSDAAACLVEARAALAAKVMAASATDAAPFPLLFPDAAPPLRAALAFVAQAQGAGEAFEARCACEAWEAALKVGSLGGRAKRENLCRDHGIRCTRAMRSDAAACLVEARAALATKATEAMAASATGAAGEISSAEPDVARAELAAKVMAASATGAAGEARSAEPDAARELPLFPALFPAPGPALSAALVRAATSAHTSASAAYAACEAWDAAAAAGGLDSRAKRRKLCAEHGVSVRWANDPPPACLARAREALAARVISGTNSLHYHWQSAASDCRSTTAPESAEAGSVCRALTATDVTAECAAPDGPLLPGVVPGCAAAATCDLNADVAALPDENENIIEYFPKQCLHLGVLISSLRN